MRIVIVCAACLLVSVTLAASQSMVLARLGTNDIEARESIFASFATGVPWVTGQRSVFRSATLDERELMARTVIALARGFAESEEFARRYAMFREAKRPEPAKGPRTGDEALAEQARQLEQVVEEARQMSAQLAPEVRQRLEHDIAVMKQQLAEISGDPTRRAELDREAREFAQQADLELARQMAEFDREYPASAKALVARRLRQFLDICGTVDFEARLEQGKDKKFRFVDPQLEEKPPEWKMCFRAGKPAVSAAVTAATEWLETLDWD